MMIPLVGKSGPFTCSIRSDSSASGLSSTQIVALITSRRLWGGILVAMPTAVSYTHLAGISTYGRTAQGVKIMNLEEGVKVISFARTDHEEEEEAAEGETPAGGPEQA